MSQRDWILHNFSRGTTQVLLAIKCLDEGVDVPAAQLGYILASSGNPREFIQRRGRLLRPYKGKEYAVIYDFVVVPPLEKLPVDERKDWMRILSKELQRIEELVADARNKDEVSTIIANLLVELGKYGK
jgi:superfamily II DNA or RNA helicase